MIPPTSWLLTAQLFLWAMLKVLERRLDRVDFAGYTQFFSWLSKKASDTKTKFNTYSFEQEEWTSAPYSNGPLQRRQEAHSKESKSTS